MGCRRGAAEVCVRRENPGPELPKRFRGPVPVSAVAQRQSEGGRGGRLSADAPERWKEDRKEVAWW